MTVVFLGGGRITSAMLAGLRRAKSSCRLVVHDRNTSKLLDLKKRYAVDSEPELTRAVARAELLVIAVRPASVQELFREIAKVNRPLLAVSLAAGIPMRQLVKMLGGPVRWARAMPSPVCRTGSGLTALAFPRTLSKKDRAAVRGLFASFGSVVEVPESKLDAFTVTFSPSHGYHALAALAGAAQEVGLDRKTALLASAHALADSIAAWREGEHSLNALLAEAATPGGIAAAITAAMDAAGYQHAIRKGLAAGLRKARANARQRFDR